MTLTKVWNLLPSEESTLVQSLCHEFNLSPLIVSILINRGYSTSEAIQSYLTPPFSELHDPYLMRDMDKAVVLMKQFITGNKRIVILGDYDVDGITATTMMMLFLQSCGCQDIDYFIPNRFEHGYGLTQASVEVLLAMKPELVLTVDNGITAQNEVKTLHHHGIETLITDHHLADTNMIPQGIIVNPNHPDCRYPFKGISGCGVVLKLIMALRKEFREEGYWTAQNQEPNLKSYLDLVALGTVADVVPLVDENRLLVFQGLKIMNSQPRCGIKALSQFKDIRVITSETIGFQFGPLLNAAGRMKNASIGVQLFLNTNLSDALKTVEQLNTANLERRATEAQMLEIALKQAESRADCTSLIVMSKNFHEGINGIVAARLAERFYKPTLVFAENGDYFKGSARSIPKFNIKEALAQCSDYIEKFGGHAAAAGCSIHHTQFQQFMEKFEEVCAATLNTKSQPQLVLDGQLQWDQINWDLIGQLERLQPFGALNPAPLFIVPVPQQTFYTMKDKHVKWSLHGMDLIGWNVAEQFLEKLPQRLAVTLGVNEYRGQRTIQLVIQEYHYSSIT